MPFEITREGDLFVARMEGLDTAGTREMLETLLSREDFKPGLRLLVIDPGTSFSPSSEELRGLVEQYFTRFSRMAVVVSKTVHYGIGRMVEMLTEGKPLEFKVFQDEAEARVWVSGPGSP